jgi:hypothetical protein
VTKNAGLFESTKCYVATNGVPIIAFGTYTDPQCSVLQSIPAGQAGSNPVVAESTCVRLSVLPLSLTHTRSLSLCLYYHFSPHGLIACIYFFFGIDLSRVFVPGFEVGVKITVEIYLAFLANKSPSTPCVVKRVVVSCYPLLLSVYFLFFLH